MLARQFPEIQRFFGPVNGSDADYIMEAMYDSAAFWSDYRALLTGDIDPREFMYRIQVLAENAENAFKNGRAV